MRTLKLPLGRPVEPVTDAWAARHLRSTLVKGIGREGLARLQAARVLVVGAGGLGSPVLMYLAATGVGMIGISDADDVAETNLQRQVIHDEHSVGVPKTESAARRLTALNSRLEVRTHDWATGELLDELADDYDLVLDCCDSFEAKYLLGDWCAANDKPLVWGTAVAMNWQVSVFWTTPDDGGPGVRLRDLYPVQPAPGTTPSSLKVGVLGPVVGQAASTMATEAVKLICGFGNPLFGRVAIADARAGRHDIVTFAPQVVTGSLDNPPGRSQLMTTPISVEQYRERILDGIEALPPQQLPLAQCLGHTTAATVTAHVAVPVFTNAAMDGFAVHADDVGLATPETPVVLQVTGEVPAGSFSDDWVGNGQAVRVMTGAMLPAGADAVVPVERTDQEPGAVPLSSEVQVFAPVGEGQNIRLAGEDLSEGDLVLEAGTQLDATSLAAAASTGHGTLSVIPAPRVAVVATGSELVAPGQPLDRGQIHDSNSIMLFGLVEEAGAEPVSVTRVSDDPAELDNAIAEAVRIADVVITTGGVSVGTHDVVKNSRLAESLNFVRVAMQPGRPQGHGLLTSPDGSRIPVVALPGNPVSVFVSWHCFMVPLLNRLAGRAWDASTRIIRVRAGEDWDSPEGRRQFIPVSRRPDGTVVPTHRLGSSSHLIASLHLADGLAIVPAEVNQISTGDELELLWTRPWL
ncbi:MAG: gephyrin-like molybdotransferase Glp [Brooklawnia sp.]|uniref:ThiF family adenylyltransferase n=1 Tax=Brooklawnia sp. TaxID=2699740 RepID=UPI003C70D919